MRPFFAIPAAVFAAVFAPVFAEAISLLPVAAQAPDRFLKIKEITVLTSTRGDARRILGEPAGRGASYLEFFNTKEGLYSVRYTAGPCGRKTGLREVNLSWNVPEWTVEEFTFRPKKRLKTGKLHLGLQGFRAYKMLGNNDSTVYRNNALGISYNIFKDKLIEITFYPADKFEDLRCLGR